MPMFQFIIEIFKKKIKIFSKKKKKKKKRKRKKKKKEFGQNVAGQTQQINRV